MWVNRTVLGTGDEQLTEKLRVERLGIEKVVVIECEEAVDSS